ncbi:unnamed protein product [Penicillium roqueforti FM164]|uniref:Genomic scaffold, ProqFM164S01 n=1 Tax=Penicillium roqueforti (strain FM164) TaxID=1365484 RepID=W6PT89_PENRF|nr:unnamed protein product [Penicillium roqueforti FM164]
MFVKGEDRLHLPHTELFQCEDIYILQDAWRAVTICTM